MKKSEYIAYIKSLMDDAEKESQRAKKHFDNDTYAILQDKYYQLKEIYDDLQPQETQESMEYAQEIIDDANVLQEEMEYARQRIEYLTWNARYARYPGGKEDLQRARNKYCLLEKLLDDDIEAFNKRDVQKEDFIDEELDSDPLEQDSLEDPDADEQDLDSDESNCPIMDSQDQDWSEEEFDN